MRSIRNAFLAGSALALVMGMASAEAADMLTPAPAYKAAPMMPAYNWSGFYAGLNVGALSDHGDINERAIFGAPPLFPLTDGDSFQKSGFLGGGQIGYNWQLGQTVLGVEADAAWSNLKHTQNETFDPFFNGKGGETSRFSSQIDWLATFRGRAGIAATPGLLLYVTAGAALAGEKVTYNNITNSFGVPPGSTAFTNTGFGWVAGLGAEYTLGSNWSVKGEYLHISLDSFTANFPLPAGQIGTGTIKVNNNLDLLRFGLNYKL
jgi:outer membrane immunogenic protein